MDNTTIYADGNNDGATTWGVVSGWQIRADWTLGGGCFIVNTYENGSVLRIGLNPLQGNGYILIADDDWASLEPNKTYSLRIEVGDELPWYGEATGWQLPNSNIAGLWISYEEVKFLLEIVKEHNIAFYYNNKLIANLSLKGSALASMEMLDCQEAVNSNKFTNPNDPFLQTEDPFKY